LEHFFDNKKTFQIRSKYFWAGCTKNLRIHLRQLFFIKKIAWMWDYYIIHFL